MTKNIWNDLWELLFPRTCPVCKRPLLPDEADLCLICERDLPLTHFETWPDNPARERISKHLEIKGCYSLYYYNRHNSYPGIVHRIKYQGGRQLGRLLGRRLGQQLLKLSGQAGWTGIVPVPLHWRKLRKRGYNQAEWIARGLAEILQLPVYPNLLLRKRYTVSQTTLSGDEKWENMKAAFALRMDVLPQGPQHFLLVDDVLTSGATAAACAQILQEQPAWNVSLATLAFVAE